MMRIAETKKVPPPCILNNQSNYQGVKHTLHPCRHPTTHTLHPTAYTYSPAANNNDFLSPVNILLTE